jgi:hypothetical protein
MPEKNIAVIGSAYDRIEAPGQRSLEEAIFAVARGAIADSQVDLSSVDSVVLSGTDQVDGRVISAMVTAGAAGAVGRDMTMIASASEHAVAFGYLQLRAGHARTVLVLSWGKPSEGDAPEHAELVSAEPFILRPIGMNDTVAAALQASRLLEGRPGGNVFLAAEGVVAWPLRREDLPTGGDLVAGLVLAEEGSIPPGATVAWIRGLGWAMDRYEMGDRDIEGFEALRAASERAATQAALGDALPDVAEIRAPSSIARDAALAVLGLRIEGPGRTVVNPGAGGERGFVKSAAGLSCVAAAAAQLRGTAGAHQLAAPKIAMAASTHGFASQGASVMILSADKE